MNKYHIFEGNHDSEETEEPGGTEHVYFDSVIAEMLIEIW